MNDLLTVFQLMTQSFLSKPQLVRTPEPEAITCDEQAVQEYSDVSRSSLSVLYLYSLLLIDEYKSHPEFKNGLELGCGPGVFSTWLAETLNIKQLESIDLSKAMLEQAKLRFKKSKCSTHFKTSHRDIRDLSHYPDQSMDLVLFMNAAHHLSSIEEVQHVTKEMDRICHPSGLIYMMDPVRPYNKKIANLYFRWIREKNNLLGAFESHNKDFYNSIHAAWTASEFKSTIPKNTSRKWIYLSQRGFPYYQFLIGFNKDSYPSKSSLDLKPLIQTLPDPIKKLWKIHSTLLSLIPLKEKISLEK